MTQLEMSETNHGSVLQASYRNNNAMLANTQLLYSESIVIFF